MRDNMKPCQHTLSDDLVYKEVVVIGNGPSGMVTSFMLAGNIPYLTRIPEDLPIDEMLRARLSNLPPGQSLYEADLTELAEGLEGRSQNPIPLLMDSLLRPCADLGIQADSLIEWKFDIEKQIEHVVLGRAPPGGAWHSFPADVRTLSPAAWLALPPLAPQPGPSPDSRLSASAVAEYCRTYVQHCHLQRYFRCGVVVTGVTMLPAARAPCPHASCPLNATFCVSGYDTSSCRPFRYLCRRVVAASGATDRPNSISPHIARHAAHSLSGVQLALNRLAAHSERGSLSVAVVGSGVSAADAVCLARGAGLRVRHLHRAPAPALTKLSPAAYPDYCQVYKMMCDGPNGNHENYTPYPDHVIVDVTLEEEHPTLTLNLEDVEGNALRPKRITLLNLVTNKTTTISVYLLAVLIGSKPDLFFLQTNFNLNCIDDKKCIKCMDETKYVAKRKIDDNQRQCFLKNHWHYIKSMVGQSIQSCKSRYLNYTEINGNTNTKCVEADCNKQNEKCTCLKIEGIKDCSCDIIPYSNVDSKLKCTCQVNPYSSGIGFGVDPKKPVDGRANPIAIDKTTHELLNAPKGIYALGPLTADNFVRFIPGGALAIVASIHKEIKE